MIKIYPDMITGNEIAAIDIYDAAGNQLIKQGAVLSVARAAKLKDAGIVFVYAQEPEIKVSNIYDGTVISGLLKLLWYFRESNGENTQILKYYNDSEVKRFLSYSNEAAGRIAYGHIFKYYASLMAASLAADGKKCYDFSDYRSRDNYSSYHVVNSACIACAIGHNMGLKKEEVIDLCVGSLLYDLKMDLYKFISVPGRLSPAETAEMEQHTLLAHDAVKKIYGIPARSAAIALQHHERFNGSGYPKGLKNQDITPLARIAAVADVYDAMTSTRPFRKAYPHDEAWGYITCNSGILFDPETVEAFKNTIPKYFPGDVVELAGGGQAVILENFYGQPETPGIKLIEKNNKNGIISRGKEHILRVIESN
ncbi:MAG: HD domain-containing protein [Spirochaetia bacterium]|nr:HD domain-containing protein [Spirochaetia bacterium]